MNVLLSQVIHVYQIAQGMLGADDTSYWELSQSFQKEMLRCDLEQKTDINVGQHLN